jgi:hypothetical protein
MATYLLYDYCIDVAKKIKRANVYFNMEALHNKLSYVYRIGIAKKFEPKYITLKEFT